MKKIIWQLYQQNFTNHSFFSYQNVRQIGSDKPRLVLYTYKTHWL